MNKSLAAFLIISFCLGIRAVTIADSFTLVALPDTQFYSQTYPATFKSQTQWIVDHAQSENIDFVAHLGDIVNRGYTASQWTNAVAAMNILEGKVSYGLAPGNHDLMDNEGGFTTTTFVNKFGPSRFAGYAWYGGASASGFSSYQVVSCGGTDYLYLNLDVDAPDSQISWAQSVIDAHPGLPTMVSTHEYLGRNGRTTSPFIEGRNSGENIWNDLIRSNDQIFMVLCGHVFGQNQQISLNDSGHKVFEMLSDYQSLSNGGNGFLRLLSFQPSSNRIDVQTYSTTLGRNLTADDLAGFGSFSCAMDFSTRFSGNAATLASYAWKNAVSGNLSDAAKWAGGVAPDAGYLALNFGGATNYTVTHDLDSGAFAMVCNRLEFSNTSGAVTLSGSNNIALDGLNAAVEQKATGGVYLDVPLLLKAPTTTLRVLSTVYATKDISGLGDLVKTGSGTLVMTTGRLALAGNVAILEGTIRSGSNDAIGNGTTLTIATGAMFDDSYGNGENFGGLAGSGTFLTRKGNGIDFGYNNLDSIFSGKITAGTNGGIGALPAGRQITVKKNGTGTTTLTGTQSDFAGTVSILAGALSVNNLAPRGHASALGLGDVNNAGSADIIIGSDTDSATFKYTGVSALTDRTISLGAAGGAIDVCSSNSTLTITSISGTGSLTKFGPGNLCVSCSIAHLPSVTVANGTLTVSSLTTDSLTIGSLASLSSWNAISTDVLHAVPEPAILQNLALMVILICAMTGLNASSKK